MNAVRLFVLIQLVLMATALGLPPVFNEMPWLWGPDCLPSPDQVEASRHFEASQAFEAQGNYSRALKEYRMAISSGLQTRHCLFLVRLYIRLNELAAAEKTVLACAKLNENCSSAELSLAFVLQKQDKLQQAEAIIQSILDSDTNNAYAWYLLGRNGLSVIDLAGAETHLLKAIEIDPRLGAAYFALGSLYSQKRSTFERATELLERAITLGHETFEVHQVLGAVHLRLGRQADAILHLEAAVQLNPQAPETYYLLGRAYRRAQLPEKSRQALERYQELQSKTSRLNEEIATSQSLYQKGMQLLQDKRLEQALLAFSEGLGPHPNQDICHFGIAQVLVRRGDHAGAIEATWEAIRARPYESAYYRFLAEVLEKSGKPADAIEALTQALHVDPTNAQLFNSLGNLHFASGDDEQALRAYRQAVQLDSANPYFHLNLSSVLIRMGRSEEGSREKEIFRELLSQESRPR